MLTRPFLSRSPGAALLAVAVAVSTPCGLVSAQTDTTHVLVTGTVVDVQRNPLEGVEVRIAGDTLSVFTTRDGAFRLRAQRAPELLLVLRRPGYNAQLLKLKAGWNGTVMMTRGAFELPGIEVNARNAKPAEFAATGKYDDFFRRQRLGFGEFITRAEIERRAPLHTPEIFSGKAGIKVLSQNMGRGTIVSFARCHEYPPRINVYVDGRKQLPGRADKVGAAGDGVIGRRTPPDPEVMAIVGEMLERINPSEIEFIEVFRGPGELPAEFNDGNCGAISIWTRQGGR